jgi:hypothetical protein
MRYASTILVLLVLAGCNGFGPTRRDFRQPPISAYMICDEKPPPKGCEP